MLASLQLGVELNPLDEDVRPLVNWRALEETRHRPALILGTSSDRIGTSGGQAFYATLSKSLDEALGLPLAPYAGLAYGTFDDELVGIGGLVVRWAERWTSYHTYDGHELHHQLELVLNGGHALGLVVVSQQDDFYAGLSWSWSFGPAARRER